ncbi:MAG: flagellar biosynthesis protein FlgM [Sulfurimonas sp. RIFCSPHIGHO2_12_FULL_36_9]|jgi:flagellar biosynthesis anti-sigma factor FlgM|uniref:flagellar biosynthesis anti-sigma factor FlgM n=1 Tax=unclassified Sulfurimonas TaxID=2623549 RepID=UPI0008BDC2F5|nr:MULTISPECIES: flagellar biosynthesis anti-sigma factor FlgM [unclassified Sulfurimonas]OHD98720.1 MAG: flagellar biosynthesis protein FlgM [Sulfurimonas sp. RIFCSPHIGHO2_12_FULL_36_9]OHD99368.1 MAG: flagellar biosynthesis protein FlgM [Sulfurimonas sp. RIFCSPLOWO2_02_FULL_36_28]OHE02530.1 MAG: flagellar biosynthesis protein FlgM [Sulfurimonas sp. RIFCSPLOWO2_12_36_12]OHE08272.1 MAG: flagellar biosynthesis protein FlgM [Sulfurimonas sp. RIFCSPLOWO2_12_FULL_36_74]
MISQINGANVRSAYANSFGESKEVSQKAGVTVSKQGDTSKVEQIKEALASGEYKINIQTLAEKIAQELM